MATTNATLTGPLTLLQAAAVSQWYDELAPALRRFVAGVLLHTSDDAPDVDDVLQETWWRLMAHVTDFAPLSSEHRRNVAFQTARWVVLSRHRTAKRRIDALPISATSDAPMEAVTASHDWQTHAEMEQTTETRMTLWAVWNATPPEHREMLQLMAAGLDFAEIGRRLGVSKHTVEVRLWRLRPMLKKAAEVLS